MSTAAQRDRQIEASEKRRAAASAKAEKARTEMIESEKVVRAEAQRIDWLRQMPVTDETPDPISEADE